MTKRKRTDQMDIVEALELLIESGKFDQAGQDLIQSAIDHIESLREMNTELAAKNYRLQADLDEIINGPFDDYDEEDV